jgi:PAS domain S-box-containing protein
MTSQAVSFEGLLETAPDALVGVDQNGVIRFVNRQTEAFFGYDRDDLLGQPIEILVPESLRSVHRVHRQDYVQHPRDRAMGTDLKMRGRRRDGTMFSVDIALSHIDTGEGLFVIAAVRDTTNLKTPAISSSLTPAPADKAQIMTSSESSAAGEVGSRGLR